MAALYDRNQNRAYDDGDDLWGFSEEPVVAADTGAVATDLYLVYADEMGDLAGEVRDSLCAAFTPPARLRLQADSLVEILGGERDVTGFVRPANDTLPPVALRASERESLSVALERVNARMVAADEDSARCMAPIWVSAVAADGTVAAEVRTPGAFRMEELPAGAYTVQAFRDLNGDAVRQPEEPFGRMSETVVLKPGRTLEGLEIEVAPGPADSTTAPELKAPPPEGGGREPDGGK